MLKHEALGNRISELSAHLNAAKAQLLELIAEFDPERETVQADGRIRRWARIDDAEGRYLRVVVLSDGETIHNAFFDRRYEP